MVNFKKSKQEIEKIAKTYGLSLVILFGSQVTGKTHKGSDVDIGFLADNPMSPADAAQLSFVMSEALHILQLDLLDLRTAPPLILQNIAQTSQLLYEREPHAYAVFRVYALKRFFEAKPILALRGAKLDAFLKQHAHA